MIDHNDVIKNYVRNINFQKNDTGYVETPTVDDSTDETEVTATTTETSCTMEKLDNIKSCESVLKMFSFEPGTFNENNEKCAQFWSTINERSDLKPVNCLIMDAKNNKKDCECQTVEEESEASLWARALYELRKRKLDKLAMASSIPTCKFCEAIPNYPTRGYSKDELRSDENLVELNDWNPMFKNKGKIHASTEINRSQLFKDEPICAQNIESLLDIKEHIELEPIKLSDLKNSESETLKLSNEAEKGKDVSPPKIINIDEKLKQDVSSKEDTFQQINVQQTEEQIFEQRKDVAMIIDKLVDNVFAGQQKKKETLPRGKALIELKENFNDVQNVVSLFNLKKGDYQQITGVESDNQREKLGFRKSMLKGSYSGHGYEQQKKQLTFEDDISYVEEEVRSTHFDCPCTDELRTLTNSKCYCDGDICKKGTLGNLEAMKQLIAKFPTRTDSNSSRICINRIYNKIKDGNLTSKETAFQVQDIMDNCACPSPSCDCLLHHIDLSTKELTVDAKYAKKMLLEKFGSALDVIEVQERRDKNERKMRLSVHSQCEEDMYNVDM